MKQLFNNWDSGLLYQCQPYGESYEKSTEQPLLNTLRQRASFKPAAYPCAGGCKNTIEQKPCNYEDDT